MAEDEIGLPKATMNRAIKERLPADMRIANDANEMVMRCCEEFVHMIAGTANELSEQDKKTTILPEHVLKSLDELGFTQQLGDFSEALEDWKAEKKEERKAEKEKKAARANAGGMSAEEMLALQQRLFAQARERTLTAPAEAPAPEQPPPQ